VGHPRAAGHFFSALRKTASKSWDDFLQAELAVLAPAQRRLFEQLSRLEIKAPQMLDDYRRWLEPIVCFSFEPASLSP
jgi:hypothetical protein